MVWPDRARNLCAAEARMPRHSETLLVFATVVLLAVLAGADFIARLGVIA